LAFAVIAAVAASSGPASALDLDRLDAVLLTSDFGDPNNPKSAKLVLTLPESLEDRISSAKAGDFIIHVYPSGLDEAEGMDPRYEAEGMYLWRFRSKIFIDIRSLPKQDESGPVKVKVTYAPDGMAKASGFAHGDAKYSSDAVDVVLAIDVSRSMNYNDPRKRRVVAARAFIEMAREGGGIGRVGLVTFNSGANTRTPLIPLSQGERILTELNKVGADGMTSLDAPLQAALNMFNQTPSVRPVVILMTDGHNEGSFYKNTHMRCAEAGVKVYTVGLSESADHRLLQQMAQATGGIYFRSASDKELPEIYARIAAELGKRYLMHADILPVSSGQMNLPIDSTVHRIVAMVDGGTRMSVVAPDGRQMSSGSAYDDIGGVYVGRPKAGDWSFNWTGATPGSSAFALFGDTPMFLDVFPPQLQGESFAVGATLAQGDRPLPGAEIWLEPVSDILPQRIRLYDDGQHADGAANDGVYGAVVNFPNKEVQRFDVILRSFGRTWDSEAFIRQTTGLTLRTPEEIEPAPPGATIESDLDFGVLFPGETGKARIKTNFAGVAPEDFTFELSWPDPRLGIPMQSALVTVNPGRHEFEIEITIPENTPPGDYRGILSVKRDDAVLDEKGTKVRVGTITFGYPGEIDLGVIPPGTTNFQRVTLPYHADKEAILSLDVNGPDGLSAKANTQLLEEGDGTLILEVTASSPIGSPNNDFSGTITLMAGPSYLDIPVRWSVRALTVMPLPEVSEPEGVPIAPELTLDTRPLELAAGDSLDTVLPYPEMPDIDVIAESPWERISRANRDSMFDIMPDLAEPTFSPFVPTSPAHYQTKETDSGDSFWNAWWIYILAALLLLLLLLLLLCYILYRLGRSAMARFILASIIANLILLAVFVALLGTSDNVEFPEKETIAVTLTEDEAPDRIVMTSAEEDLMAQSGSSSSGASAAGSSAAEGGSAGGSLAPGGESVLPAERSVETASSDAQAAALKADRQMEMAAGESASGLPNRRRGRLPDRERQDTPSPQIPEVRDPLAQEMQETVADSNYDGGREAVTEPVMTEIVTPPVQQTAMADAVRREASVDSEALKLAEVTEPSEMEFVEMAQLPTAINVRDNRRRSARTPDVIPEPRVEIEDPVRDASENAYAQSGTETVEEASVAEARIDAHAVTTSMPASRPPMVSQVDERVELAGNASGTSEVFEDGLPSMSMAGRRDLRSGRRSGQADGMTPGGHGVSALEAGDGGGNERSRSNRGRGSAAGSSATGSEARFDGGGSAADGDGGSGLFASLDRSGSGNPGGTGTGPANSGALRSTGNGQGQERASMGGGGQSNLSNPGRGGGDSRRGEQQGGDEPSIGSVPGSGDESSGSQPGVGNGPSGTYPGAGGAAQPGSGGGDPGKGGAGTTDTGNGEPGRGDEGWDGLGDALAGLNNETRINGLANWGEGLAARPNIGIGSDLPSANLGVGGAELGTSRPGSASESGMNRSFRRRLRRGVIEATSSLDANSLIIVVGDFARMPDTAVDNLFGALTSKRLPRVTIEERKLNPDDANLGDTLLALASAADASRWTNDSLNRIAQYLKDGGHIWIDNERPGESNAVMERLAEKAGGEFEHLPPSHQLAEGGDLSGLYIGENLAAVVTDWDWRRNWRYGNESNGKVLRFLARNLNFFLSGNADQGIEIDDLVPQAGLLVEAEEVNMPSRVASDMEQDSRVRTWQSFNPSTTTAWRSAPWGDKLNLSSASDGSGGQVAKLDFDASEKGRMALYRSVNPIEDFSVVESVAVPVYYDGEGAAAVSLIMTTPVGGAWVDHESAPVNLIKGWNSVMIPVRDGDFRQLSGSRQGYGKGLDGANSLGRFGFIVYRQGTNPGVILLGDIKLNGQ
jgi:Mg-chelatase subunit ChlD